MSSTTGAGRDENTNSTSSERERGSVSLRLGLKHHGMEGITLKGGRLSPEALTPRINRIGCVWGCGVAGLRAQVHEGFKQRI